jgi:Uma2 family endonuclease
MRQALRAGRSGDKRRRMTEPAPAAPGLPARMTVEQYFALMDQGILEEGDKVELLEGVVVAMAPENVWHADGVRRVFRALTIAVGTRAFVDQQHCFIAGARSVPEPDVAVLPGTLEDYSTKHPSWARLVVEVADSSLAQDRLTKAGIYAAADVAEYWIVSRRGDHVQVSSNPIPSERRYAMVRVARRGETIILSTLPDVSVRVDDLLPPQA